VPEAPRDTAESGKGRGNMNDLKRYRLIHGLKQPELAKRLQTVEPRLDVGMISRYENNLCLPTRAQLEQLEDVLHTDRITLFGRDALDLLKGVRKTKKEETFRKGYRISREFAAQIPDDVLKVCGYSSWNAWHMECLKRLLSEYAAKKRWQKHKEGQDDTPRMAQGAQ
jgi:transcriptional regulator with XRE-family HTH domain